MPAPHPRMHGLTHVPGGPDPIPFTASAAAQAILTGPSTAIAANATDWLPFTADDSYDWLDFSSLTHPHVLTAGVYAMTCNVICTDASAPFWLSLSTGDGFAVSSVAATAGFVEGSAALTITFAADTFFLVTVQNSWSSSRNFQIEHFVIVKVD